MNIDSGVLGCPAELPGMANEERLIRQVTEKVMEYGVSCPDLRELPRSPDSLMRMPTVLLRLLGTVCVCVCVAPIMPPPPPSQADERAVHVRHTLKETLLKTNNTSHHTRVTSITRTKTCSLCRKTSEIHSIVGVIKFCNFTCRIIIRQFFVCPLLVVLCIIILFVLTLPL